MVPNFPRKEQFSSLRHHNGCHPSRFCPIGTFLICTQLSKTLKQRDLFQSWLALRCLKTLKKTGQADKDQRPKRIQGNRRRNEMQGRRGGQDGKGGSTPESGA